MKLDRMLSRVVLPAPVPPLMRQLRRDRTHCLRNSSMLGVSALRATSVSALSRSAGNRRIESSGPSTANGGITALTRDPSGSRASTMGELSSMRRPTPLTIRSMTRMRCWSSWNAPGTDSRTPPRSTYTCLWVLHKMSLTDGSRSNGSSGPNPNTSSRMSPTIASRSVSDSGMPASAINDAASDRISASARSRSADASASRFRRASSLRWILALRSRYCTRRASVTLPTG